MVALSEIREFGKKIGEHFHAEKVILFGSYATGEFSSDSDVDLLVIGKYKGRSVDKSVEIRMKLTVIQANLLIRNLRLKQKNFAAFFVK